MAARGAALLAATIVLAAGAWAPAGASAQSCDEVASPGDSDAVDELLDSLQPGQTGCLHAGTYTDDQFSIDTPAVTLTSYPGERAVLQGRLRIEVEADGAHVENLMLDGRNPDNLLGPLIYADGVVLRGNEITNGNTAICVHVDGYDGSVPHGVVIEGNRIHHCGRLPATNKDHGIYVAEAVGTVIRGNWIYANADRGVQLYPDADGSTVTGNVIDGNGQGVLFGGDGGDASDHNVVEGNVIANSTIRHNIEDSFGGPDGAGNVARGNCVWGGAQAEDSGGIEEDPDGFAAMHNLVADPLYVDRAGGNFNLRPDSPCLGASPRTAGPRVKLKSSRRKARPRQRFRLRGRVRGATEIAGRRVIIRALRNGHWRRFAAARIDRRNRFSTRARARSRSRRLRLRAEVTGVGRSGKVRVRIRR